MSLATVFDEQFPISSEHFSLEFVPESVNEGTGETWGGVQETDGGHLAATLRLFVWDVHEGERSVRDIKEQQVVVLHKDHVDDPRVPAYLEGWVAALRLVFERHDERLAAGDPSASDRIEGAMPHEFVFPDVLALRRPQTAEEFTDALLSGKKRLGGKLP